MLGFGKADALEEMGVELAGDEIGMGENALVQRDRGLDSLDDEAIESALHADDRFGTVAAMRDQLGDQRIVIGRNDGVGVGGGVDANSRTAGNAEGGDAPGRRNERVGIFGVDAALDGVAAEFDTGRRRRSVFRRRRCEFATSRDRRR